VDQQEFKKHYLDLQKGRISRRRFMEATGLATAAAVIAACAPASSSPAAPTAAPTSATPPTAAPGSEAPATMDPFADWTPPKGVDLGKELYLTTWPNYHDPKTIQAFTDLTGVKVNLTIFGSNEEMLAKLQAGGTGWDVLVPTNYTFETYGELKLLEPLDLAKLPRFDAGRFETRFLEPARYPAGSQALLGVSKNWGTTGYVINTEFVTKPMASWKDYFDLLRTDYTGKAAIHDYQLTGIGAALKYFGYSFNSVDTAELAKAEELLVDAKKHFFAITSDYQPPMRNKDAWIAMAWWRALVGLLRGHRRRPAPRGRLRLPRLHVRAEGRCQGRGVPRVSDRRRGGHGAPAGFVHGQPDHLPGRRAAEPAGVRGSRDADRPEPGGALGALQVGLRVTDRPAAGHP
jgi:spermidine/putrescine-binding protein